MSMILVKYRNLLAKLIILSGAIFTTLLLSGWVYPGRVMPDTPPLAPPSGEGDEPAEGVSLEPVDVIKNGGFEMGWQPLNGVPEFWSPYTNGEAVIGWYDEQWPEAVRNGNHAQLMEIDTVNGDILDRVIAVYQTVDVAPNSEYTLTIHAIMRTDAPESLRNKNEYEMNWGIDPFGEGNYDNVSEWVYMPLTEQLRIGSNGEFPDDKPLFYEVITGTIRTGDTEKITLFIRGLKKFPTGTEVNFDIDDVSLIGPSPGMVPMAEAEETAPTAPADSENDLPQTGATLYLDDGSVVGKFALGAMVLLILGTAAAASLLFQQNKW